VEVGRGVLSMLLVLAFAEAGPCRAALVINEVLYDPDGPDAGREFVEIRNTGRYAAPLFGLTIEAGNGARPDDWDVVWNGPRDGSIPPDGIYRVGLDGPGAGEPAQLGLQNGPDGVRLSREGFVLDRCGWGDLAHPEYFEGHPARAVRAGMSLARADDGVDTDDNAADFVEADPTPGRPNRPGNDWAVRLILDGAWRPEPGGEVPVRLRVANQGREVRIPPSVAVEGAARSIWSGWSDPVIPGAFAEQMILLTAPEDTGRFVWRARIVAADEVPENDADSLALRAGAGNVRITEIMADPGAESSEWIELRIDAGEGRTVSGREIDIRGRRIRLGPRTRGPGTRFGIVAEDSAMFLLRFPQIGPECIWQHEGSWPRLRNGDRSGGVSETLLVRAPDGVVEEIALPGPSPSPGVSLERLGGEMPEGPLAWVPCSENGGASPGRAGLVGESVPAADAVAVRPRVVHPGSVACWIEGNVGSAPGEVRLSIHDLHGGSVRCLLRGLYATGKVIATWDGRDELGNAVDPGVYIAVLEVERKGGSVDRHRAALAVAPVGSP
jgi:hypothetical protein